MGGGIESSMGQWQLSGRSICNRTVATESVLTDSASGVGNDVNEAKGREKVSIAGWIHNQQMEVVFPTLISQDPYQTLQQ